MPYVWSAGIKHVKPTAPSKLHQSPKHRCGLCDYKCFEAHQLRARTETIHMGTRYCCTQEDCTKSFKLKQSLKLHLMEHAGQYRFMCDFCAKGFNNTHAFDGHVNKHHGEKPYQCPKCSKGFTYQSDCSKHQQTCGMVEGTFTCDICKKS